MYGWVCGRQSQIHVHAHAPCEQLHTFTQLTHTHTHARTHAHTDVSMASLEAALVDLRKGKKVDSQSAESVFEALEKYGCVPAHPPTCFRSRRVCGKWYLKIVYRYLLHIYIVFVVNFDFCFIELLYRFV